MKTMNVMRAIAMMAAMSAAVPALAWADDQGPTNGFQLFKVDGQYTERYEYENLKLVGKAKVTVTATLTYPEDPGCKVTADKYYVSIGPFDSAVADIGEPITLTASVERGVEVMIFISRPCKVMLKASAYYQKD
jgi:hypothetical protein